MGDTFASIASGYGQAQQTMSSLGLLPSSFQPMDNMGAAPQVPTPMPPQFTQTVATTVPYPAQAPQVSGAQTPMPPQFQLRAPQSFRGAQMANFGGPQMAAPQHRPAMPPAWMGVYSPQMPPPTPSPPSMMAQGTMLGDMALANNWQMPVAGGGMVLPAHGQNVVQARMAAARRTQGRVENFGLGAIDAMSLGTSVVGAGAAMGMGGAALGTVGAVAGMAAAPLMAAGAWADAYRGRRQHARGIEDQFSNLRTGGMVGPGGVGMSTVAASQISQRLRAMGRESVDFNEDSGGGDFTATLGMAQGRGLMRGHSGSVGDVVKRIKSLAQVSKSLMDLGEGITQQDAMDLQSIAQDLGMGTGAFQKQQVGKRLVAAARAAGTSVGGMFQGAGAQGAGMFGQMGMNASAGMLTGIHAAGMAGGMMNMMTPDQIARFGGQSGMQQTLMGGMGTFQARNARNLTMGSMGMGAGGFSMDQDSLQGMLTGGMSLAEGGAAGSAMLRGEGLTKEQRSLRKQFFQEQSPDILRSLQEQMGPQQTMAMMVRQATEMTRKNKGMTMGTAFQKLTGDKNTSDLMMQLVKNPGMLQAMNDQHALVAKEGLARTSAGLGRTQELGYRMSKGWGDFTQGLAETFGVEDAASRAAQGDYDAMASAAGIGGSYRPSLGRYLDPDAELDFDSVLGGSSLRGAGQMDERGREGMRSALGRLGVETGTGFLDRAVGGIMATLGEDKSASQRHFEDEIVRGGANDTTLKRRMGRFDATRSVIREMRNFKRGGATDYLEAVTKNAGQSPGTDESLTGMGITAFRDTLKSGVMTAAKGGSMEGLTLGTVWSKVEGQIREEGKRRRLPSSVIENTIKGLEKEKAAVMAATADEARGSLPKGELDSAFARIEEVTGGFMGGETTGAEVLDRQFEDFFGGKAGERDVYKRRRGWVKEDISRFEGSGFASKDAAQEFRSLLTTEGGDLGKEELDILLTYGGGDVAGLRGNKGVDQAARVRLQKFMKDKGPDSALVRAMQGIKGGTGGKAAADFFMRDRKRGKAAAQQGAFKSAMEQAGVLGGGGRFGKASELRDFMGDDSALVEAFSGATGANAVDKLVQDLMGENAAEGLNRSGNEHLRTGLSSALYDVQSGGGTQKEKAGKAREALQDYMQRIYEQRDRAGEKSGVRKGKGGTGGGVLSQESAELKQAILEADQVHKEQLQTAFGTINEQFKTSKIAIDNVKDSTQKLLDAVKSYHK